MLTIAAIHPTDFNQNHLSTNRAFLHPIGIYHHDTIPPNRESLPDPSEHPCPTLPPPPLTEESPPLGLRLQALVRAHLPVAAAITRINNLRQIRYTLHWHTGDLVQDTIEELVEEHSGEHSWTMAYDNAEFLTVMPDCTLEEARERAHHWQQMIANHPWQQLHPALQVTVSVGVAAQDPLENYEALLADADVALRCSLS